MSNSFRARSGLRPLILVIPLAMTAAVSAQSPPRADPESVQAAAVQAASGPPASTRAELLRRQRDEKQRAGEPAKSNGLKSTLDFIETDAIFLLTREGFYPKLGSLTTGSGFAAGVGYRNSSIFNRYGTLDVYAAGSLRRYWALEGSATFPQLAHGRLFAQVHAGRREYPQEDFFGLGPDAARDNQVSFALRGTTFGGRAGVRPTARSPLLVGGGIEYLDRSVGRGTDDRVPSIEEVFDDSSAPGLARQPDFIRTSAFAEVDYRKPLYARNGGYYRLEFSHFDDRDLDAYTFNRVDVDLRQYVGFFADRRVLSGRVFVSTSDTDDGQQVPFYMMPYLGGNDTLRGFREYRFRGPHALLMQAEYRFEIWSGLDMAFFHDWGKVALRRADLDLSDLEKDYGFGFRFNTDSGVVMRIDAGFGSRDGKHLYITFGGVF